MFPLGLISVYIKNDEGKASERIGPPVCFAYGSVNNTQRRQRAGWSLTRLLVSPRTGRDPWG